MTDGADAYSIPTRFEAELVSIYESWRATRRGDNDMPFSDDVNLPSLGSGADDAALIDVLESPLRFRLGLAGRSMVAQHGPDRGGKFLDEPAWQVLGASATNRCDLRALPPVTRTILFDSWR